MIPSKTYDVVGGTQIAAAITHQAHDDYALSGNDLNEIAILAARLSYSFKDADELRDWQNRLNLMIADAVKIGSYESEAAQIKREHDCDQYEEDRRDAANDAYLAERDLL